jgi:hypothetical protein
MARQTITVTKPTNAGDSGAWGTKLNTLIDALVTAINNTDLYSDSRPPVLNYRGAWAATTAYAIGDVVKQANRVYMAPAAFTSGSTFSAANWIDLGSDVASTSTNLGAIQTAFLAGLPYSTPFLTGGISNQLLPESEIDLARMVSGRALATGALLTASFYLAVVGSTGSVYRPVLYKIDPTTQTGLTLLADFGQVDCTTGTGSAKSVTGVALLAPIAVGDFLAVGGVEQGAATTRASIQCAGGFDSWFPGTIGPSVPQGLAVTGVTGAPPASPTATVKLTSATASVPRVYITSQS